MAEEAFLIVEVTLTEDLDLTPVSERGVQEAEGTALMRVSTQASGKSRVQRAGQAAGGAEGAGGSTDPDL